MDKKVEGPKVLLNAVVFGDNEIDTSATDDVMLITDRQIKSQVDQDKLKKEEAARKKKLARREREEAALAAQKGPEAVKELAVASQGTELKFCQCTFDQLRKTLPERSGRGLCDIDRVIFRVNKSLLRKLGSSCTTNLSNSEKENRKLLYLNLETFLLKTLILHLVHAN